MTPPRLGERLVAQGLLSPANVRRALGFQEANAPRVRLGSILLNWDLIDEPALLQALAAWHRCEAVTGEMLLAAPVDVARLLPGAHAARLNAMPYAASGKRIRVAFVDPSNLPVVDEVAALTGRPCIPGVATEIRLLQAHRRFYARPIPFELRPAMARRETARAARPAPAVEAPAAIPIVPEVPPAADASVSAAPSGAGAPISVPDASVPAGSALAPPVAEPAAAAASEAAGAGAEPQDGHWIASAADTPQSAAVRGMWHRDASIADPGDLALACVPPEFPRAILWRSSGGALVPWRARGLEDAALALLGFGVEGSSIFSAVLQTETPHFGRLDPDLWPDPLPRLLPGPPPCGVFPIHGGGARAAVLYADRRGAPMRFDDTGLLARAAAEIAALLLRVAEEEGR